MYCSLLHLDHERVINTKIVLVAEEFEKFQIGVDAEVTFCLKELKVIKILVAFLHEFYVRLNKIYGEKPQVSSFYYSTIQNFKEHRTEILCQQTI